MLNLETIKQEVYKNEKRKLYIKLFALNLIIIAILMTSLSNTQSTMTSQLVVVRKDLDNTKKKVEMVTSERDSLKNLYITDFDSLKKMENSLIKKTLSVSFDNKISESNTSIMKKMIDEQLSEYSEMDKKVSKKIDSLKLIPTMSPISLSDFIQISDKFGYRIHPLLKRWLFHEGIDMAANKRTDVMCTADGVIEKVYREKGGYGNRVVINHGNGYKTVYAHLSNMVVIENQKIKRGDKIGYVGSTGLSTNNHLHYEVLLNNKPLNPLNYMDLGREYIAQR